MANAPTVVSRYMRDLQRKSAASRWGKLSPEQRSAVMRKMSLARWAKRKGRDED